MKNIHLIPTNKPSRLHLAYNKIFYLSLDPFIQIDTKNYKSFNLYITSDEEIKDGFFLDLTHNIVIQSVFYPASDKNGKKVILTTDENLIKNGVQKIDDEFLEWFIIDSSWKVV